jgi:hypothetical protein
MHPKFCHYSIVCSSPEATIHARGVRLHVGLPLSKTTALYVSLLSSIQVKVVPPICMVSTNSNLSFTGSNPQFFPESGTQRPDWPLLKQTSSFKLVAATQQAPFRTVRFALAPWRSRRTSWRTTDASGSSMVIADARATRVKKALRTENFILRLLWKERIKGKRDRGRT